MNPLRGIPIILAASVMVVWTVQTESDKFNVVCNDYVEERALKCSWNCTPNAEGPWKICYSKNNRTWEWRVLNECSSTITSESDSIHYNPNMRYTVAVGLERSDCYFRSYRNIDPKQIEKILSPVEDLHIDSVTSTSAVLSWRRKRQWDWLNLELNITCHCQAISRSKGHGVETTDTRCVIAGLHPYTSYNVTVQCKPEGGSVWVKNPSDTLTTNEDAPASPPQNVQLRVVNQSVVLSWTPPPSEDQNGNISDYIVNYYQGNNSDKIHVIEVQGDADNYTFSNLQCYEEYTFSISAKTIAESPASNFSTVLTSACAPSMTTIRTVNVEVLEGGSSVVHIIGSVPIHMNGPAPKYVTVAQWEGGSFNTTSYTPEASLPFECPLRKNNSPTLVKFSMYAVNYQNGMALRGPVSETMNQTMCASSQTAKNIIPIVMVSVFAALLCICACTTVVLKIKAKIKREWRPRHVIMPDIDERLPPIYNVQSSGISGQYQENSKMFIDIPYDTSSDLGISEGGSISSSEKEHVYTSDYDENTSLCAERQKAVVNSEDLNDNVSDRKQSEIPTAKLLGIKNLSLTLSPQFMEHLKLSSSGDSNDSCDQYQDVKKTLGPMHQFEDSGTKLSLEREPVCRRDQTESSSLCIGRQEDMNNFNNPHSHLNNNIFSKRWQDDQATKLLGIKQQDNLTLSPRFEELLETNSSSNDGSEQYQDVKKTVVPMSQFEDSGKESGCSANCNTDSDNSGDYGRLSQRNHENLAEKCQIETKVNCPIVQESKTLLMNFLNDLSDSDDSESPYCDTTVKEIKIEDQDDDV